MLTGSGLASIWSEGLARPIIYGSDDPSGFEQNLASFVPNWVAYEMRLMAERYVGDGMVSEAGEVERVTRILGRPLHSYREFEVGMAS